MFSDVYKETEKKMQGTKNTFNEELKSIRAGRANPALLDQIVVDSYGTAMPLEQISNVSAPEPRLLVVQPWDVNLIPNIEKAILKSDLGLNPSNDGKIIRLPIPLLTEERRKDLVRVVKQSSENAKIAIRNTRRESNVTIKALEKEQSLSEDDRKIAENEIQKITDKFIDEIDVMTNKKEEELLEI